MLHIEKDIIRFAKYKANLELMPVCLPSSDIEHGSACYTTQMPGFLKRERKISLNLFESEKCSIPKYNIDENDICAGFPTSSGDIQGYQGEINFGAALICFKSNDLTRPILTGISSRKDLSPNKDKPGIYTNIFRIKSLIQGQLGKFLTNWYNLTILFNYV